MPETPAASRLAFQTLIHGLEKQLANIQSWIQVNGSRSQPVTTAQRNALTPTPGLQVYVIDAAETERFQGWNGTKWQILG